jgi:hypothetical protein
MNSARFVRRVGRSNAIQQALRRNSQERQAARRSAIRGEHTGAISPPMLSMRKVQSIPDHHRSQDTASADRFATFATAPEDITPKGVTRKQEEFDELVERAVLEFSDERVDAFRDFELFALLKKATDGDFDPKNYAATFSLLLRQCRFLDARGGKYCIDREFDAAITDRDVTVSLAPFEYRQPATRSTSRRTGSGRLRDEYTATITRGPPAHDIRKHYFT